MTVALMTMFLQKELEVCMHYSMFPALIRDPWPMA